MKVFITYAYAGIGHKKAALAIGNALREYKDIEISTFDVLDYSNGLFRFLYPRVYLFLIDRASFLWGLLYYFLDISCVDKLVAPLRRIFHCLETKKFAGFILKEKPDVILCTHFLPADVVSYLKKKGLYKGKLITVITDFMPHAFWIASYSDYFIVAIDKTKKALIERGINGDNVKALGIPCEQKFSLSKSREGVIKKLGLETGYFTVLVMGGGFGTGPVREIVRAIYNLSLKNKDRIQVLVICGKNKALLEQLNVQGGIFKKGSSNHIVKAFGYVDNVDEFMGVSDLIVTKSGGLTVSEALSKRLPMIIIKPIPGQETRNSNLLTGYGTAVRANNVRQVRDHVENFILYPEKILGMKTRINLLAYPNAAREIAEFIVK